MRNILLVIKIVTLSLIGLILQLLFHEYGHVVMAILTGNTISDVSVGSTSYTTIKVVNQWSVSIISLGAFILPIVVCLILNIFKNKTVNMLSAVILFVTIIQLAINAVAIMVVKNDAELQTYDLGILMVRLGVNGTLVAIGAFVVVITLCVWLVNKFKKVVASI